jgi:predicted DNA-binding protein (MmcQ/YjbR family)
MTIADIQSICSKLSGVTEDIKLGDHLCFNVGGKTFLFTYPDSVPVTASFKVPDEDFEELTSNGKLTPQAYLARYKWVHVDDITRLSKKEWEFYLKQSYSLIATKLPGKVKKQIGFGS